MKNKNISINDICTKLDGGKSAIKETQLMQCFPLNSILKAVAKTTIDILSLDVEVEEYGIIMSLFQSTNDMKFRVGSIEIPYSEILGYNKSLVELSYLMKRNGYELQKALKDDNIYVRNIF